MADETSTFSNLFTQSTAAFKGFVERLRHSVLCRFATIGAIVLAMGVPLSMVEDVVFERAARHKAVLAEIAGLWGAEQTLIGPVLVLPYREKLVAEKQSLDKLGRWKTADEVTWLEHTAIVLPRDLDLAIELQTTRRKRGIYEALVYTADVALTAVFARPEVAKLVDEEAEVEVDWAKAYLAIGLSDMHAIKEVAQPTWAGETVRVAPNTRLSRLLRTGFHVPLEAWTGAGESFQFDLSLKLDGSGGLRFAAVAERTEARITSNWPHPSFQGTTLPAEHRIDDKGFAASWRIPALARGLPRLWDLEAEPHRLDGLATGVAIAEPVHLYAKVERAVKYAVLYVALTFLTFLVFELVLGARLHLVQYGLVGLALALFYLTLLSLAEHIAFPVAYLLAAAVIVAMIAGYAWAALQSRARAGIVALALSALYAVLYTILLMEDFALLAGTGLLILVTALLMAVTRNLGRPREPAAEPTG